MMAVIMATMLFSTGCTEKGTAGGDTLMTDTLVADTTDSISSIVETTPMPTAADELFDDFFFNFAGSRKVQMKRIDFPLTVTENGKKSVLEKAKWKVEHFFMQQGYYTLIFDNKKQLGVMKDTTVNEVTVERIAITKGTVKRWHFVRTLGQWKLADVSTIPLKQHGDAAFLTFYQKFATDATYQQASLTETVTFTGPDPEDDFSTMTGEILPEQWPMFAPWMPSGTIYNIIYGNHFPSATSNVRYFFMRGIANGMQTDMMFVRTGGKWRLKKVET